jgi:putative nucleotidyltransferase with HDIG domain
MVEGVWLGDYKNMNTIQEIISSINQLKPASCVSDKVIDAISNPESSAADIVELVKYDQSLTVNLLRLCNSAYVGAIKKITSIKQSVALLGMEKVLSLIMLANNAENFVSEQKGYDLLHGDLWRYSVSSAIIAQELAMEKQVNNVAMIFTAALIKDIGKVILSTYVADAFEAIQNRIENKGMTFSAAEKDVLGIDHAELGAMVAQQWHFDPEMVEIIKYHHDPLRAGEMGLPLCVVYVADCICMMIGQGVGVDGLAYRHYQEAVDRLGVTAIDLQRIIVRFREKFEGIEALINISGGFR